MPEVCLRCLKKLKCYVHRLFFLTHPSVGWSSEVQSLEGTSVPCSRPQGASVCSSCPGAPQWTAAAIQFPPNLPLFLSSSKNPFHLIYCRSHASFYLPSQCSQTFLSLLWVDLMPTALLFSSTPPPATLSTPSPSLTWDPPSIAHSLPSTL